MESALKNEFMSLLGSRRGWWIKSSEMLEGLYVGGGRLCQNRCQIYVLHTTQVYFLLIKQIPCDLTGVSAHHSFLGLTWSLSTHTSWWPQPREANTPNCLRSTHPEATHTTPAHVYQPKSHRATPRSGGMTKRKTTLCRRQLGNTWSATMNATIFLIFHTYSMTKACSLTTHPSFYVPFTCWPRLQSHRTSAGL